MREFNIVLAGVGGQGTLLAAEALGMAAVKDQLNVRVSEIHGMAQRGGSVVSTVRIGQHVMAPTVMDGQAHVLLGFEPLETLRSLKCTSEKTLVLMSTEKIPPSELAAKNIEYPKAEEIAEKIHQFTRRVVLVDAAQIAKQAGSILTRGAVLLGALAGTGLLPVKTESLKDAIRELVPSKHTETNMRAFELGFKSVKEGKEKT